jgi:hypothetical protein
VPSLDRSFPDHFDSMLLADHLVDQFGRYFNLGGGPGDFLGGWLSSRRGDDVLMFGAALIMHRH